MASIESALERKAKQNPQMEYLWRIELPALPGFPHDIEEINHRVTAIEAPEYKFETKKNTKGASYWYSLTNVEIGDISIKIDEMEDGLTLKYFKHWESLIINENGLYYPPVHYKKKIKVTRITSTEFDLHTTTYHGYTPTGIGQMNYSYDSTGIMTYNISLTGDRVTHQILEYGIWKENNQIIQEQFLKPYNEGFWKGNLFGSGVNNEITDALSGVFNKVKSFF